MKSQVTLREEGDGFGRDITRQILEAINSQEFYSEAGWA